ncbi:MAG: GlmL-related ornithine degradation protein [Peptostreptococcaceae bacterium]|nr:GlmL-related ornithine degradation protein [Peptostreptococcaceae bacterium]
MKIDVLVAEIGSTTTVVNAFNDIHTPDPVFLGQGQAPTSVLEGDVRIGLSGAIDALAESLGADKIEYEKMLATSSAAGGLKMTVHGLVYDMTARAAKEAALGAGAIIHQVTAGRMRRSDIKKIEEIRPNIILLAGGVDYGERDTALFNAEMIAELNLPIPLIYAGNVENHEEIRLIFENTNYQLYLVDNVYPKIDELNVEPTRKVIQDAFEEHIIHAPGMERVRDLVNGPIIPTPGAVMESAKLLHEKIGDVIVLDVGGATTDLHSVTKGSEEIERILVSPEPLAKRTVEGDLGVFVNMPNIVNVIGKENIERELGLDIDRIMTEYRAIPKNNDEKRFVERLTLEAVIKAVERHAGRIRNVYGPSGRSALAEGKDLTEVRYIVGTGGALTRLPGRIEIMKEIARHNQTGLLLFPTPEARILVDNHYIMASLGVLSKVYKESAFELMCRSLGIDDSYFLKTEEEEEDVS